ncbi:hypothetical protein AAMO2058_000781600 [Amorphochlora amoebiformis]
MTQLSSPPVLRGIRGVLRISQIIMLLWFFGGSLNINNEAHDVTGHGPYQKKKKANARTKRKSNHRKLKMRNNYMIKKLDEIRREIRTGKFEVRWDAKDDQELNPYDLAKPYCRTCARQFIDPKAYASHVKTKDHKKRIKRLKRDEDMERAYIAQQKRMDEYRGFALKDADDPCIIIKSPITHDSEPEPQDVDMFEV